MRIFLWMNESGSIQGRQNFSDHLIGAKVQGPLAIDIFFTFAGMADHPVGRGEIMQAQPN